MSKPSAPVGSAVCLGNKTGRAGAESLKRDLGGRHWLQGLDLNKCRSQGWGGKLILFPCAEVEESVGWS